MQIGNLRGLLGIRRVECQMHERIGKSVLQWFDHIERMRSDRIAGRVYVGNVC